MKKTHIAAGVVAALALTVAFGSPYIALHNLSGAVAEGDAETVSEYIDFPSLRESLKGQIMAGMASSMDTPEMKSNPFASMGKTLGMALAGPMVDAMVSPAGIIALMSEKGKLGREDKAETGGQKPEYKLSFKGMNKVLIHRLDSGTSDGGIAMCRFGLWNWKMTSIDLPAGALGTK